MDYDLAEDDKAVQEVARNFARQKLMPRAREIDNSNELPPDLIAEMARLGLLGMNVTEEYGGMGATTTQAALTAIEIGYADISMATAVFFLLDTGWPRVLQLHGKPELKKQLLPLVTSGKAFLGIATTEPSGGSDLAGMKTHAVEKNGKWYLSGEKTFISGMKEAERMGGGHLTLAKTGPEGSREMEFFYVPANAKGITVSKFENMGRMGISTCQLNYENVELPELYRLGDKEKGKGFYYAMDGFNAARVLVSAACIGASERALEMGMDYIKKRKAFGSPIGKFEGIQFELADLYGKHQMTREMVLKGGWYVDKHPERLPELIKTCAIGKLYAPQVAFEIVQKVMMWFGAISYSKEFELEMGMRGLMSYLVGAEGSLNMMRVLLGRELLGKEFIPYK